ncbi:MAG: PilZ domain-containing protein [Desulfatitalea sp.]
MESEEKRLYPRLVLKIEEGYFGRFILPDTQSLSAPIVDLSAGGINIAIPESAKDKIKGGDLLLLRNIAGGARLNFLADIKSQVRWVKKLELPKYFSVGCRFIELPEAVRMQLSAFVDTERMTRGQYV